jgi:hypothetical protein
VDDGVNIDGVMVLCDCPADRRCGCIIPAECKVCHHNEIISKYPHTERRCPTCGRFWRSETEAQIITKGSFPGPIVNRKASRKMGYDRFDARYKEIWE